MKICQLWSTPKEVIDAAIEALEITPNDIVYDIGCGDGRFLVRCSELTRARSVGIDINEERIIETKALVEEKGLSPYCTLISANALDLDYSNATAIFLYLIPRGLRLILPKLLEIPHPVRIVTYMAPFPADALKAKSSKKVKVQVGDQLVEYPIFIYETEYREHCVKIVNGNKVVEEKLKLDTSTASSIPSDHQLTSLS